MSQLSSTYHSNIFQAYKDIEARDYRAIVSFYESHKKEIKSLDFHEFFELRIAYVSALFEVAAYQKYLAEVDDAIEVSIMNNIKIHKGYNVFQRLLFRKAASHYHLGEYKKAKHILRELVKICPSEDLYSRFLKKCMWKTTPTYVRNTRAISIFMFMLSAFVILVELLFVKNFFPDYTNTVELSRNIIFLLGWTALIGGDAYNFWSINDSVKKFIIKVKAEKLRKHREKRERQHTY